MKHGFSLDNGVKDLKLRTLLPKFKVQGLRLTPDSSRCTFGKLEFPEIGELHLES